MVWSTPMTAVPGEVFTAAQFNTYVRDNLLETGAAKANGAGQVLVARGANDVLMRPWSTSAVATSQTTTSTSYTDLATVGPSITTSTGSRVMVTVEAQISSTAGSGGMGVAVSGASTVNISNSNDSLIIAGTTVQQSAYTVYFSSLTAGSNTFTAKYVSSSGASTATFAQRRIIVMPLS